ncbi:MAG: hypothetical protein LUG44_03315 [Clostridiales bacterium]|nr:hypothetical protein [Clostridiales bacterium]
MKPYSKLIRRIPPFRNLYRRVDELKKEDAALKKSLSAAQKEAEQQYKALEQQCEELVQQCKALERQDKTLEQQCKELKKQIDVNGKRCQEIAEQERKDCAALRDELTAASKTAAERDQRNYERLRDYTANVSHAAAERDLQNYKKLSKQMGVNRYELSREAEYYYYKGLEPSRYPDALKEWYYHQTGKHLNLEHPRTYTEKIQWLKLYDSTPLKGRLSDKYLVRDYVREKIGGGYLVPLLGVWDRVEDIPFDDLPEKYALKATHGCEWNIIVHDKNQLDVNDARRKLKEWLQTDFAFRDGLELHYRYTEPRIIAEQYIENAENTLFDYRFFCFDGKVYSIWIDVDSGTPTHRRNIYTPNWELVPLNVTWPHDSGLTRKPKNLEKMIQIAETLSQGFYHVRVDLYEIGTQIYFGEMTFTPMSGKCEFDPPVYNEIMGDLIHLPCDEDKAQ